MASLTKRASDVRINEVALSTSLSGVSSCTGALVLVGPRGFSSPRFYSNADDFLFDYGNPNAAVSYDHYSALDYLREGNSLWVNRVVGAGAKYSAAVVKLNNQLRTEIAGISGGVTDPSTPDWGLYTAVTETPLFLITPAQGQGSFGNNISVQLEAGNLDVVAGLLGTTSSQGGQLVAGNYEYSVAAIATDGNETLASAPLSVIVGSATTTNSITVSWNAVSGAIGYRIYGRVAGSIYYISQVGSSTTSFQDTGVITPDTTRTPITTVAGLAAPNPVFKLKVFDATVSLTQPVESFNCSLVEQTDDTGGQMEITQKVNPFSRYIRVQSNVSTLLSTPVLYSTTRVALTGGASGTAPTTADINKGWDTFNNKELYTLDVLINGGKTSVVVQKYMDYVAQTRNDCIAYLDMPSTKQKAQAAVDYRNLELNLNSSYSAIIAQDLQQSDAISGKILYVPPSGAIAGLLARTFRTTQPWFSTAGLNRGLLNGVTLGIREAYDDGQATLVTLANIAYVRKFLGRGIAFWEQNTLLNKSSALQDINIRVLCNIIKRASYNYLIYSLQEPNDDILRKSIQFALEQYLDIVKAGRGISNYRVVIDSSNNPPALSNAGVLAVAIVITPIRAVREIQLTLVISKEGLEVDEKTLASL